LASTLFESGEGGGYPEVLVSSSASSCVTPTAGSSTSDGAGELQDGIYNEETLIWQASRR
jgi:hypothetical protein